MWEDNETIWRVLERRYISQECVPRQTQGSEILSHTCKSSEKNTLSWVFLTTVAVAAAKPNEITNQIIWRGKGEQQERDLSGVLCKHRAEEEREEGMAHRKDIYKFHNGISTTLSIVLATLHQGYCSWQKPWTPKYNYSASCGMPSLKFLLCVAKTLLKMDVIAISL